MFLLGSITQILVTLFALRAGATVQPPPKFVGPRYHRPAVSEKKLQAMAPSFCIKRLSELPGKFSKKALAAACQKVIVSDDCQSEKGSPIFYFERDGYDKHAERILAISLIHGDEHPAGSVGRNWMIRLNRINPRNTWRVIPLVNPDGAAAWTRYNAHGVDLNRNFPSSDWNLLAHKYWHTFEKNNKRRYPGPTADSERETQCIVKQIAAFKPDFIISVHTPYGVLDLDGPKKLPRPNFYRLPWYNIGTFPGSLGRYMWVDHHIPVLTIELHFNGLQQPWEFNRLQDLTGTLAIRAREILKREQQIAKQ